MPYPVSDSRRLTGANLLLDGPGAALEVALPDALQDRAELLWRDAAVALCEALGWPAHLKTRRFDGGITLALSAPIDALYTATELNEAAWAQAEAALEERPAPSLQEHVEALKAEREAERDPALRELAAAAAEHDVSLAGDDEWVTLGMGAHGQTWAADALPDPDDVAWTSLKDIPAAFVTGTNGKSTTVRLLAALATAAGHTPGLSSTDYVMVGDEVVERGDFSGPMGARALIADPRVTCALFEAARGGLLRRGVGVPRVTAAAVTNVAADHLGDYGILDVPALAEAKFVVAQALGPGGTLVLNRDDPPSVAQHDRIAGRLQERGVRVAWTGLDPESLKPYALAASVVDEQFALRSDGVWTPILPVEAAPCTRGGAARHNVRNGLTAVALGHALGFPNAALAEGLKTFRGDDADNPGRANRFDVGGASVLLDYAHNAHGLDALVHFARHAPARRRLLMIATAGDRRDQDLEALARVAASFEADRYLLPDLPEHRRGRAPGELPAHFARALQQAGVPEAACRTAPDTLAAVQEALEWAGPGDQLVLVVLSQRAEVLDLLKAHAD